MENLNIVIDKAKEEIYLIEKITDLNKDYTYKTREAKKNILNDIKILEYDEIKKNYDTYNVINVFNFKDINYYYKDIKNPYGITNQGNTCFFNGIIQLIINNKLIITNISRIIFYKLGRDEMPKNTEFVGEDKLYYKIIYILLSLVIKRKNLNLKNKDKSKFYLNDSEPEIKYLNDIIKKIQTDMGAIQTDMGAGQQDADEVLKYFINNRLSINIKSQSGGNSYDSYKTHIESIISILDNAQLTNYQPSDPIILNQEIYNLTLPEVNYKTLVFRSKLKTSKDDDKKFLDSLSSNDKLVINHTGWSETVLKVKSNEERPPLNYIKKSVKLNNESSFNALVISNDDKSYYECFLKLFIDKSFTITNKHGIDYWEGQEIFSYPIIFNEILIINLNRGMQNNFFPKLLLNKSTKEKKDINNFIKRNDSYYYIDIIDLINMLFIPESDDDHYNVINDIINLLKIKYKNKRYRIYSLVIKIGGVSGGHYYSYNYVNDKYWKCNDAIINESTLDNIDEILVNSNVESFIRSMCLEMIDSPN